MADDTTTDAGQDTSSTEAAAFDFDTWLGEQPENVRGGLEQHTAGLKSALDSERTQRKDFAKQLRDLEKSAEDGSEAKRALGDTLTKLEQAEQRAAFYEGAGKSEIGCTNAKAAYLVAKADDLFTRSGDPDWNAIKAAAPELFGRRIVPPGNAGTGNGSPPAEKGGMNDFIRAAAGRG